MRSIGNYFDVREIFFGHPPFIFNAILQVILVIMIDPQLSQESHPLNISFEQNNVVKSKGLESNNPDISMLL